ncbi:hypothetical protein T459_02131 [Capsicum annuum]|uniref:Uncharacterized protein n=1 Tax=Capsicum annuum TaxID=4072 RepID=A0A2G3AJ44_CAPAN|nr:hypothetical protein T459_02131 [Capsicum annuum]
MRIGKNFVTGREVYLSSWNNEEDPALGDHTYHCDLSGYPQNIMNKGSIVVYSSGQWNVSYFSGTQNTKRRKKVATTLLKACDVLVRVCGYEYLVIKA